MDGLIQAIKKLVIPAKAEENKSAQIFHHETVFCRSAPER